MNLKGTTKKGLACAGLGLLVNLLLCMDVLVLCLEMVFYKDAAANGMTVWQYCLHFILVCTLWGLGSFAVYKFSKGKKLLPGTDHARKRFGISGIFILFLLVASSTILRLRKGYCEH